MFGGEVLDVVLEVRVGAVRGHCFAAVEVSGFVGGLEGNAESEDFRGGGAGDIFSSRGSASSVVSGIPVDGQGIIFIAAAQKCSKGHCGNGESILCIHIAVVSIVFVLQRYDILSIRLAKT